MAGKSTAMVSRKAPLPKWVEPQLTRLVPEAPDGPGWLHEIKYDGYRMHGRIKDGAAQLLTRTGLDWSHRYKSTIKALSALKAKSAYVDGELCAVRDDGVTSFSRLQASMDEGGTGELVYFVFDLLHLNGENVAALPLLDRKARLEEILPRKHSILRYSDHVVGNGPGFRQNACKLSLEGAVSKQIDREYAPGDRGIWVKSKCLNREEFVVVGWTPPEGSRPYLGALLLGYYTPDGELRYAGRVGTGMTDKELKRLAGIVKPLGVPKMPLAVPPTRKSRFGSPLELSKVQWMKPKLVVEVVYLTWTEDNLLRQVSYQGVREDKAAKKVVRPIPNAPKGPARKPTVRR